MFIFYILDICSAFFSQSMFYLFFLPVFCLAFIATIPFLLMRFFRG